MTTDTIKINGIATEVPAGAVAYKHADPVEDARWLYDEDEAQCIASEDPSLIVWTAQEVDPDTGWSTDVIEVGEDERGQA